VRRPAPPARFSRRTGGTRPDAGDSIPEDRAGRARANRGDVVIEGERGEARVYLVCEPASHSYAIMTRSAWMPVLIGERI
jgi:hypothetical protein